MTIITLFLSSCDLPHRDRYSPKGFERFGRLTTCALTVGLLFNSACAFELPASPFESGDTSSFEIRDLPVLTNGWGDKKYQSIDSSLTLSSDTLYKIPQEDAQLPQTVIDAEGDLSIDFANLRFDVDGAGMNSFARVHQQNSTGALQIAGTGNFEARFAGDAQRMLWVSATESSLEIDARNVWLEFCPSYEGRQNPSSLLYSSGEVTLHAEKDFVLAVAPENELQDKKFSIVELTANPTKSEISASRLFFTYLGEESAKLDKTGIWASAGIDVGDEKTEYVGISNVDTAISFTSSALDSEPAIVMNVRGDDVELLGTGSAGSTGIFAEGKSDLYLGRDQGNLSIKDFETAVYASYNAYVWVGASDSDLTGLRNLEVAGNISASTDGLVYVRTASGNMSGNIDARNWGVVDLSSTGAWIWSGSANVVEEHDEDQSQIKLDFGSGSRWTVTDVSRVTDLRLNGSSVDLSQLALDASNAYQLEVSNTFASVDSQLTLASNLSHGEAAKVYLGTSEIGSSLSVGFRDKTETLDQSFEPVHFATTTSSSLLEIEAATVLSENGLTLMTPTISSEAQGDETFWYVSGMDEEPGYTPQAIQGIFDDAYFVARSFREGTLERFGELQNGANHGFWGRITSGSLSANGLDHDFVTYRLGADTALSPIWSVGFMLERSEGDVDHSYGSGDSDATAAALYFLGQLENGVYVDAGLRFGRMDYDYANSKELVDRFNYRAYHCGGWIEAGIDLMPADSVFVRPHAALQYGWLGAKSFATAQGLHAEIDDVQSLIMSVGADLGWRSKTSEFSFTVEGETETMGDMETRIRSDAGALHLAWSHSDFWIRTRLNASFMPVENLQVWFNGSRTFAAELKEDWRANLGVRWSY